MLYCACLHILSLNKKALSCEKEALIVEKAKEKQVVSDNANLIDEWNWERNSNDSPMQLTVGSHKKVWWKCHDGHEWQAEIKSRYYGKGCPYCSGRYAIKGINDLQWEKSLVEM